LIVAEVDFVNPGREILDDVAHLSSLKVAVRHVIQKSDRLERRDVEIWHVRSQFNVRRQVINRGKSQAYGRSIRVEVIERIDRRTVDVIVMKNGDVGSFEKLFVRVNDIGDRLWQK
jgi:hypothetical protein